MPDTSPHSAPSRKLGGIPQSAQVSPGIYRKPRAFRMKIIPRPVEVLKPVVRRTSKAPAVVGVLLLLGVAGGGFFLYRKMPAPLAALLGREHRAPVAAQPTPPPDATPLAEASPDWMWLFEDPEWRLTQEPAREFAHGVLRLRTSLEKPQPQADGAIRARLLIREAGGGAGVFLRSTPEQGRYRLYLDADLRHVRLVLQSPEATQELAKFRLARPLQRGDRVVLELRAEGEKLSGSVNGTAIISVADARLKNAGTWGIEAADGWFDLVEVPRPAPAKLIAETPPAPPPSAPPPAAPAMTPPPSRPPEPPALSETAKWLAGLEPQWQASFEREVVAPSAKALEDLKKHYLAGLETQLASAAQARKLDDAAFFRGERQRIAAGEDVPAVDEVIVPAGLKQMRVGYRSSFARLDRERFDRAKAFHARIDTTLAQSQAALGQRQRAAEAAEIKQRREQLAVLWIQPLAKAAVAEIAANTTPATTAERPALGAPASAAGVKLSPRQSVEQLLAIGASVFVNQRGNMWSEVTSVPELASDKFVITRVEIRRTDANEKPLTAADLTMIEGLQEVTELGLHGPAVTDAVLQKLKGFRNLQRLTLDGVKMTAPSYAILPLLAELRELELRALSPSDESMKIVGQCRKVRRLELANLPIGDEAMASVARLGALEELSLNNLDKITSPAVAQLAACSTLRRLTIGGMNITSPMIEALARCSGLEALNLGGAALKDDQIAALGGLSRLQVLGLNGTQIVGSAFASWPVRGGLHTLNLDNAAGVNDAALRGIASAFPKLQTLSFKVVPLGAGTAFAAIGRLRLLRTLRISGEGVSDEIAAELAKCDDLHQLTLGGARLTDIGIAALARLPRLTELQLDLPPVTEPALKSFAKMKALKTLTIAETAPPETEQKLRTALPGIKVTK